MPTIKFQKYPEKWQSFTNFTHNQIEELMSNYGKVDILWLDGGWVRKTSKEEVEKYLMAETDGVRNLRNPQNQDIKIEELAKKARKHNPKVLIVDRACEGSYQDYLTPEQEIPENGLPYPWETCMTMAASWGYKENDVYKSSEELIKKLADVVSKGGNFLLNIGPSPDGEWDETAYSRLQDMGKWTKKYGEAIYRTHMFEKYGEGENIRFTASKDHKTVYVFLLDKPQKVTLQSIPYAKILKTEILGFPHLKVKSKNQNITTELEIPEDKNLKNELMYVVKLQLKQD